MPLTGPIPEGRSYFCPRCGALYAVTYSRQSKSVDIGDNDNAAKCVVCGQTMATQGSTDAPTFKHTTQTRLGSGTSATSNKLEPAVGSEI